MFKKIISSFRQLFCEQHSYDKIVYELETESGNYYSKETLKECCKCGHKKLFIEKRYY